MKCPLTLDYGYFRMMLEEIGPHDIARGGTLIGDALRKALLEVFDEKDREFRDVILITDGDDQESFPVEAARQAGRRAYALSRSAWATKHMGSASRSRMNRAGGRS